MNQLTFTRRTYLAATLGLLLSAGCGGSSAPSTGRARISVAWPSPSRFVPQASLSIRVTVKDEANAVVGEAILDKPTTSVTLSPLPVGTLSATAVAYPQAGAGGVAQASATAPLNIQPDANTDIALTLASTIQRIDVTPAAPSLPAQTTQTFAATAYDAANQIVLTPGFAWSLPSGASFASVDATSGVVTGLAPGEATVRATDAESGKSGEVAATIRPAPVVTVSPTSATIFLDQTKSFSASVSEIPTQTVAWSVKEGATGGTVTASGVYAPPATPGSYTLVATSTVDSRWKTEVPLTIPAPAVVFTQTVASVGVNRSATFAARIDNLADSRITWSVKESGGGTISSAGVYTAPATRGTYTVVATSMRDVRYKAEFSVRATAGTGVIVIQ